ncbi:MAG: hemolysin family protein [Acidobacteriota bacterium]
MESALWNAAVILLLIAANGLLALSEIAVVSARKTRLMKWAARGDRRAQAALDLQRDPGGFLSTVQTGITLVGVLAGAFGGATLAEPLARLLEGLPIAKPYLHPLALGVVVLTITYLSILLGELVPKHLALSNPERLATAVALPLRAFSRLSAPAVWLLAASTRLVLKTFRIQDHADAPLTEEELRILMDQGTAAGTFEAAERDMVHSVFRLSNRRAADVMTPRQNVVWLDAAAGAEDARKVLSETPHARYPVARGSLDNVLGVVHARDLLLRSLGGQPFDLLACLRPPAFVPENTPALKLLEVFRGNKVHMAFVVDEYGAFQGVVSLNDFLENVVGEMAHVGHGAEAEAIQREDGSWLLDGMLPIDRFKEIFQIHKLPGEDRGHFRTVGGFVMRQMGRIPKAADTVLWQGMRIEVVDMDGRRVDKVLVSRPQVGADRPEA